MHGEAVKRRPKVSVIMPVFNCERYLAQAIESVLNQTYKDFELIVVDDGSTDNSPAIIREYAQKDMRIRCAFHEENQGVSAARNTALDMAKGEWIAVIDSDDVWHPQRLEKLLSIVEEGFFVADDVLRCFDRKGELIPWKRILPDHGIREGRILELNLLLYLQKGGPLLKPVFPHVWVNLHQLRYTEGCQFAEDFEFLCHLFRIGLKLRILNEPLYFLRLTPNSLSAKINMLKNFDHHLEVYNRLLAHPGFLDEEKRVLKNLRYKVEAEKDYLLFTSQLEDGRFREAIHVCREKPSVLLRLLRRLPRSLAYRLSAKIRGAAIRS